MALAAYRNLLRAARIAFQGDGPVLAAARDQIRSRFRQQASLESADVDAAIRHADDVAKILRENVVQGRRAAAENTYRLRIHEHTERGTTTASRRLAPVSPAAAAAADLEGSGMYKRL